MFRRSKFIAALLAVGMLCASVGALIIPTPPVKFITDLAQIPFTDAAWQITFGVIKAAAAALIVIAFAGKIARHSLLRGRRAVHGVYFQTDGVTIQALNAKGKAIDFGEAVGGFASPLLSTLIIQNAGGAAHTVLIMPDSLDKNPYRHFRIRLKHALTSSAPDQPPTP